MKNLNVPKAIVAGLVGTLAMTFIMVMAPMMGMPKMDIAASLGSMFGGAPPAPGTAAWIAGLVMHLMIGTVVLSILYSVATDYLPKANPVLKGLIFGVVVWLIAQLMVMPMMGAGVFSSRMPQGTMMAMGSLIGHLIYGGILGSIYGQTRTAAGGLQVTGR